MSKNKEFTTRLAELLKSSGRQQKDIAEELGMAKNAMTDYISGRATPDPDRIRRLCQILDCSYEDLLGPLN